MGYGTQFVFLLFDWNPNLDECFFIAFRDSPGPVESNRFNNPSSWCVFSTHLPSEKKMENRQISSFPRGLG